MCVEYLFFCLYVLSYLPHMCMCAELFATHAYVCRIFFFCVFESFVTYMHRVRAIAYYSSFQTAKKPM